ncbi:hypothetical protein CEXT_591201 [Caerostris extrusa]|uniref:Uncharacterized protein n=1 Tax=Caerostris extrusa TaxID=172846 RepID=A0AAV4MUK3_CAEEX|nr:hypothetical protein CEXT_591201 [Caerostris extrusa]
MPKNNKSFFENIHTYYAQLNKPIKKIKINEFVSHSNNILSKPIRIFPLRTTHPPISIPSYQITQHRRRIETHRPIGETKYEFHLESKFECEFGLSPAWLPIFREINVGSGPMKSLSPTNEMQRSNIYADWPFEGPFRRSMPVDFDLQPPFSSPLNAQCPSKMGWWRNGERI